MRSMKMRVPRRLAVMLAAAASVLVATAAPALASPPSNDDISNATVITTLPFNDIVDLSQATNAPGDQSFCGEGAHTVWYQFTPATSGNYILDPTASTGQDVALDVFTGSPGALTFVTCANGGPDDNGGVNLNATAGTTYWIMGSVFPGFTATLDLWVYPAVPPRATVTVTDVKVDQAGNAHLTGILNCTGVVPNQVNLSGTLTQPIGRKNSVSGGISASANCAQGQTWNALVQPTVGKFAGGAATASFGNTFVCNLAGCSAPLATIVIKLH